LSGKRTTETIPQCDGSQDEHGNPVCDGADVRRVTFVPAGADPSTPMGANWCAECRELAAGASHAVRITMVVGEVLPPKPTSYPCRNAFCSVGGKPRRVTREREYCSTACQMEALNESPEGNR
jgi:hypothetical protein